VVQSDYCPRPKLEREQERRGKIEGKIRAGAIGSIAKLTRSI